MKTQDYRLLFNKTVVVELNSNEMKSINGGSSLEETHPSLGVTFL